jgi:hypothetical protein
MPTHHRTAKGQLGARGNLSRFVQQQADQAAEALGFEWIGTPEAPATYPQLRAAFAHSAKTGEPLPVSSEYCDDTVFLEPGDNVAFRFWHDVSHCRRLGLSFALPDEWELTLWHLNQMLAAGYAPSSLEYQLLRLDLLGQIILLGIAGRFPFNQGEFTRTCHEMGLDVGVLTELRRIS